MANDLAKTTAALAGITGRRHVLHEPQIRALEVGYHHENLSADVLVLPVTTSEVSQIAAFCEQEGIGLVPQGGRTGLSGGAASKSGQVIIALNRMSEIEKIDKLAAVAVVGAGVTLQAVEEAANLEGLSVGIDLAARGTATIGGMISTNAGGMEAFRNGSMRHRIAGLEAVLSSGQVLDDMVEITKCNEGYDIKQLFCGAEGTLGIVTRAVLRLVPVTPAPTTLLIGCNNAEDALSIMRASQINPGLDLLHAEIMWHSAAEEIASDMKLSHILSFCDAGVYVILEVVCRATDTDVVDVIWTMLEEAGLEDKVLDALVAKNERERRDIWMIRENSFAIDNAYPHSLWFDVSVPLHQLDAYVALVEKRLIGLDPAIRAFVIGHLADGNLHYTIGTGLPLTAKMKQAITRAVFDGLKQMAGAFSAEHGIGIDKRDSLHHYTDPVKIRLMQQIKQAFDPKGIMNPGKVV